MLDPPRTESPDSDSSERVFLEWLEQRDRGASITFEGLCAEHPSRATRLGELRALHERAQSVLGRLARPLDPRHVPRDHPTPEPLAPNARYELKGEIARGGMGAILEVYDPGLRRTVAMKILRRDRAVLRPGSTDAARQQSRLLSEAQILAQLDHPGVVAIHEMGLDERGRAWFTMKRVRGQELGWIFRLHREGDREWKLARVVGVLVKVCEAVAYAHQKGVIHRDLKPSNVLVGRFGEVFVMDWGLAKTIGHADAPSATPQRVRTLSDPEPGTRASEGDAASAETRASSTDGAAVLSMVRTDREADSSSSEGSPLATLEGEVVGTPAYMPPEQARGEIQTIDARTDVYAVGAMLYHLLAGRHPYAESTACGAAEILAQVLARPPEALERAARHAPEELVAVCAKAMARDPARRYASMLELAEDLRAFLEDRVVRAHKTGAFVELRKWVKRNRWVAASFVILIVALAAIAVVQTLRKHEVERERLSTAAKAEELRRQDYANRIALAASAYASEDILIAKDYLDACPADLRGWEWRHLARELDTSDRSLPRRGNDVVTWSPDGRWVSATEHDGRDKGIRAILLDAATLELERAFPLEWLARGTCFSPDNSLLAVSTDQGVARLWNVAQGREEPASGKLKACYFCAFSPDGQWLVGHEKRTIHVYRVSDGELVRTLAGHADEVSSACFSPDGRRLYSGSWDRTVRVWDAETGDPLQVLNAHENRVCSVQASPDGRFFASAGWDGDLIVFDALSFAVLHRIPMARGHAGVVWSPDSKWLATHGGAVVHVYDTERFERRMALVGHDLRATAVFSPDSSWIASAGSDGIRIWDLRQGARNGRHTLGAVAHHGLAFSPDGRWLACKRDNHDLEIWDAVAQMKVRTVQGITGQDQLRWSPTGKTLAVAGGGALVWVDTETWTVSCQARSPDPNGMSFSSDGKYLSITDQRGFLSLWDVASGERLWSTLAYDGVLAWPFGAFAGTFSPDGELIATGARDGCVKLWRRATGQLERVVRSDSEACRTAVFSPDGRMLITGGGQLQASDVASGDLLWASEAGAYTRLAFSADGRLIFMGQSDGRLGIWDAVTGRRMFTLDGYRFAVSDLAVSPDGERVATSGGDSLQIYDARPWREPATAADPGRLDRR